MIFTEDDIKNATPMMQSFMRIKNEHEDKLIFYRLGDFYELFFNDAVIASKILGLTLTKRGHSAESDNPIPMAGIPHHAVDGYLYKAVKEGYSIAIFEQVGTSGDTKGIMERKISRIITPGTVLDAEILDGRETKLIASVFKRKDKLEIAWINFASGEILVNEVDFSDYIRELDKIDAIEILVSEKQKNNFNFPEGKIVKYIADWEYDLTIAQHNLNEMFGKNFNHTYGLDNVNLYGVISAALKYIKETQRTEIRHIQNIKMFKSEDYIQIDYNTRKHLELITTYNKNTLFGSLDYCSMSMGSRLLKSWILYPIRNKEILNSRWERVNYLKKSEKPYLLWKNIVSDWCDLERMAAKIGLRTIRPKELASLRETLREMPKLVSWADKLPNSMKGFFTHAIPSEAINKLLEKYLQKEPNTWVRDGNVIANGVDAELDECRELELGHSKYLKDFENSEKIRTQIANLKVESNSAQGFFINITNSHLQKIPSNYIRKQTLKNSERFITEELKLYEAKAFSAKERAYVREKIIYDELLDKLQSYISILQKQAKVLAEWDVLCAFSEAADLNNYSQPKFSTNNEIVMKQGRHPVLESLVRDFVPNDVQLSKSNNAIIITGPNMGGKSTFMRQLALLTIMAHIGSFVSADVFEVPEIDAIYTRIGAQDDLAGGRSTFMVEMSESAYILNHASSKSLVLIDELGRGTATYDGLSLAWSIAQYLANTIKSYMLFATHYLEMTELEKDNSNISNLHVSALEKDSEIIFNHLMTEGSANKSYGIQVAKLAGINPEVIRMALRKLSGLEANGIIKNLTNDELNNEFNLLDVNNLTAKQALDWLFKMKDKFK